VAPPRYLQQVHSLLYWCVSTLHGSQCRLQRSRNKQAPSKGQLLCKPAVHSSTVLPSDQTYPFYPHNLPIGHISTLQGASCPAQQTSNMSEDRARYLLSAAGGNCLKSSHWSLTRSILLLSCSRLPIARTRLVRYYLGHLCSCALQVPPHAPGVAAVGWGRSSDEALQATRAI
jgi:hypothetical protein